MTTVIEHRRGDPSVAVAALDSVQRVLDAVMLRNLDALRAGLHEHVRVRMGGSIVADGRDAAISLASTLWRSHPEATITVIDAQATDGPVYVRTHIRADDAQLGYSIVDTRRGLVHEISTFVSTLTPAVASAALAPAPGAVIDLRDGEPPLDLRDTAVPQIAEAPPGSAAPEDAPQPAAAPALPRRRRMLLPLAALGSWLVQDLLLAAPVVATAASIGSWRAFVIFAPSYTVLSLVLSLVTVRMLRTPRPPSDGRFARWLAQSREHPRLQRWLRAGGVLGFVVSSYALSGPPTVWALHRLGVRRGLWRFAVLASITWGVTFVVSYLITEKLASLLL